MATYEDAKFARLKLSRACADVRAVSSVYVGKNDQGDHVVRVYLREEVPEGFPEEVEGVKVDRVYLRQRKI